MKLLFDKTNAFNIIYGNMCFQNANLTALWMNWILL